MKLPKQASDLPSVLYLYLYLVQVSSHFSLCFPFSSRRFQRNNGLRMQFDVVAEARLQVDDAQHLVELPKSGALMQYSPVQGLQEITVSVVASGGVKLDLIFSEAGWAREGCTRRYDSLHTLILHEAPSAGEDLMSQLADQLAQLEQNQKTEQEDN